jgi:hypothetical protein
MINSNRFFAVVAPSVFVILLAGWASASSSSPDNDTRQPGRCVTIETLITDPITGDQHIQRKIRCEYTEAERAGK